MATRTKYVDWGGLTPIVDGIRVGATKPGQLGTELTGTEIALLDGVTSTSGIVASKAVIANASGTVPHKPVIIKHTSGASLALTAIQSGATVVLAKADGILITLPASAVGLNYKFVVNTSVTSNVYKISTATQGTEFFDGSYNSFQDAAVASTVFTGDGTTHDNFSMNGSTTGGLLGTVLWVECTAANLWTVTGWNRGSGAEITSFATT